MPAPDSRGFDGGAVPPPKQETTVPPLKPEAFGPQLRRVSRSECRLLGGSVTVTLNTSDDGSPKPEGWKRSPEGIATFRIIGDHYDSIDGTRPKKLLQVLERVPETPEESEESEKPKHYLLDSGDYYTEGTQEDESELGPMSHNLGRRIVPIELV